MAQIRTRQGSEVCGANSALGYRHARLLVMVLTVNSGVCYTHFKSIAIPVNSFSASSLWSRCTVPYKVIIDVATVYTVGSLWDRLKRPG